MTEELTPEEERRQKLCAAMSQEFQWEEMRHAVPFICWPPTWLLRALPPMYGVFVRYEVARRDNPLGIVGIAVDVFDGWSGEKRKVPVWLIESAVTRSVVGLYSVEDMLEKVKEHMFLLRRTLGVAKRTGRTEEERALVDAKFWKRKRTAQEVIDEQGFDIDKFMGKYGRRVKQKRVKENQLGKGNEHGEVTNGVSGQMATIADGVHGEGGGNIGGEAGASDPAG